MCGVFGVFGHDEAANLTYLGLHSLQHRGQESAGIVALEAPAGASPVMRHHAAMGLVSDIFTRSTLDRLVGRAAIGHVRYSTSGSSELRNAQPFLIEYKSDVVAIAHNGNLVNAMALRAELERNGSIFQTSSDTEVIVHLMAQSPAADVVGRLQDALGKVTGAFSITMLTRGGQLIAARDPRGFRPLALGRLKSGYVVSSETSSFDLIEADYVRDVEPGEILVIDDTGLTSRRLAPASGRPCVFEYVYFARPDSVIDGAGVYSARIAMGERLATEAPIEADVVIPVPDSGVPAAIGFARVSGIPFAMGLIRSHYVGRTFIEPQESIRHFGVRLKLSTVRAVVDGKRVVVVDDSLVRGTTSRKIVKMLRAAGATEVHLRISAPPTTHPCFYGIDTPSRSELVAATHTPAEIARYITCDSLLYLSHAGLVESVDAARMPPSAAPTAFCDACFTGHYPVVPASEDQAHLVTLRSRKPLPLGTPVI
ncbi:MAG: amidophosphoribosyltransferase [Myxococcales bacterium]|nr:amidophosphoribosyltransferase [Myxococcales bacterium]